MVRSSVDDAGADHLTGTGDVDETLVDQGADARDDPVRGVGLDPDLSGHGRQDRDPRIHPCRDRGVELLDLVQGRGVDLDAESGEHVVDPRDRGHHLLLGPARVAPRVQGVGAVDPVGRVHDLRHVVGARVHAHPGQRHVDAVLHGVVVPDRATHERVPLEQSLAGARVHQPDQVVPEPQDVPRVLLRQGAGPDAQGRERGVDRFVAPVAVGLQDHGPAVRARFRSDRVRQVVGRVVAVPAASVVQRIELAVHPDDVAGLRDPVHGVEQVRDQSGQHHGDALAQVQLVVAQYRTELIGMQAWKQLVGRDHDHTALTRCRCTLRG